jgi:hypothetical protein
MPDPPSDWRPLLGQKVSIRFALTGDPAHPFSEAIGVVGSVDGDGIGASITIFTKRGERVIVRAADVLAAKVFPSTDG